MCATALLVFTQATGLIEILFDENLAKNHAFIAARGILDVYTGHLFYITIANFGKADVNLSEHQKVR